MRQREIFADADNEMDTVSAMDKDFKSEMNTEMDHEILIDKLTALEESEMQLFRFLKDRPAGAILTEETDRIMKAQLARGADFESGNLLRKAKALIPLLVPLFVSAFRRANDLSMAMEARCYRGGDGRTKMNPLVYSLRDRIGYLVILIYLAACIGTNYLPVS